MHLKLCYLTLLLTTECNLRCIYCYREGQESVQSMPKEVAEESLRLAAASQQPFHVQLTGGEPSLEPELIEWAAAAVRKKEWPATLGLQTNGTLLNDFLLNVCKRLDIQIGVSLDGPLDVQEKLRGKAAATLKGLKLLAEHGVPFRVTTVVTQHNVMHLGRLALLLGAFPNARGLGLDLLVQKGRGRQQAPTSICSPESLEAGLKELLEVLRLINEKRSQPIQLRELEQLRKIRTKKRAIPFCHACRGESMAVHPTGAIYPCAQTVGDPYFASGTVWAPDVLRLVRPGCGGEPATETPEAANRFADEKTCSACPLERHCPGDCPSRQHYNDRQTSLLACVMHRTLWEWGKRV